MSVVVERAALLRPPAFETRLSTFATQSDAASQDAAVARFIAASAGGRAIIDKDHSGRSRYLLTDRALASLTVPTNTTLEFHVPLDYSEIGVPTVSSGDGSRITYLRAGGSVGSTVLLDDDVSRGDDVLPFAAGAVVAAGFAIGDWLFLKSTRKFPVGYAYGFTAEQVLIKDIDGDDVQLAWAVADDYLVSDSASAAKIDHAKNVQLLNPLIIGTGRPASVAGDSGIQFQWVANCHVRGGELRDVDYNGVRILNGLHCTVRDLTAYMPAKGANENVQYAVSVIDASQDCEVSGCEIFGGKHGVAGSVSSGGVQRRLLIEKSKIFDTWSSGSAVHENAELVTWLGNELTRCNSGFDVRCAYAHLESNKVRDLFNGNEGIGLEISRRTVELTSIDNDFGGGRFAIRMAPIGYQFSGSEGPTKIKIIGGRSTGASTRAIELSLDALNNGQITSDFGWDHDSSWNFESTVVGSVLATGFRHTPGSVTTVGQDTDALQDGESYRLSFRIFGRTAGTVTPRLYGGTPVTGTARSADGTYTEDLVVDENTGFEFVPSSGFDGIVDRVSLYRLTDGEVVHYDLEINGFKTNESAGNSILINGPFARGKIVNCDLNGVLDEPSPQTCIITYNVQDFLVANNTYGDHAAPSLGGTSIIQRFNHAHGALAAQDIYTAATGLQTNWSPDVYARNVVTAQAWTTRTPATTNGWNGVCWSPELGLFVAVGGSGTGNRVMTSPDGVTWAARTSAADNTWLSVCWSPELSLFVAVGSSGTGNRIMTSPDGITWTSRTNPEDNSWWRVCWSPELTLFVAVAASGTNRVMTSPDGVTWTARSAAAANQWVNVCWSPELGLFVAVAITGTGNRVMTSPDGITWTSRTSPADNDWRGLCWSPELSLFVAVAVSGTGNRVMTSPDGITWTLRTSPADNDWRGLCWSPALGLFVAIAGSGTGNRVMTSPDGITWTLRASAADRSWQSVCWSPELEMFISVASGGTSTDVQCVGSYSGVYTPTLTNETNLASSTAAVTRWSRVKDMISVFGKVTADPTAAGQCQLGMSLPVPSLLSAEEQCGGSAASKAVAGFGAAIYADATNDRARFEWIAVDTASRDLNFSFSYRIVA